MEPKKKYAAARERRRLDMSDQPTKDEHEIEVPPPRYDFSGAIRGRVARRFTPEERDELIRRAVIEDTRLCAAQNKLLVEGGMNIW